MPFVYVISNGKLYKIGIAKNVQERLSSLQTATPDILKVLRAFQVDNAIALEGELHDLFHEKRVHGEWFDLLESDLLHIDEHVKKRVDGESRLIHVEVPGKDPRTAPTNGRGGDRLRKNDWIGKYGTSGRRLMRVGPRQEIVSDYKSSIQGRPVRIWWEADRRGDPIRCVEFLDE